MFTIESLVVELARIPEEHINKKFEEPQQASS
jgi:hypothetical protein